MPKDIRSFFSPTSKKKGASSSKPHRPILISDSDDDIIEVTPVKETKTKPEKSKLKAVDINDFFGDKPIRQSKVAPIKKVAPSNEKETSSKKPDKNKRKKKVVPKAHQDQPDFVQTLNDLDDDDDIFLNNLDELDKTIEEAQKKFGKDKTEKKFEKDKNEQQEQPTSSKGLFKHILPNQSSEQQEQPTSSKGSFKRILPDHSSEQQEQPTSSKGSFKRILPDPSKNDTKDTPETKVHDDISFKETLKELDKKENVKKRPKPQEKGPTPKKQKLEQVDSGIDADQEAFEKKLHAIKLYEAYKQRGGPKHHGEKELPKGSPNCLSGLTFLRTGVLDSLESQEFEDLVKAHGGRVVHAVSRKVNYVVVGDVAGPAKLAKARSYNIKEISEDELLDLILVKSGMAPKFVKHSTDESGVENSPNSKRMLSSDSDTDVAEITASKKLKKDERSEEKDVVKTKNEGPRLFDNLNPKSPEKQDSETTKTQNGNKESEQVSHEKDISSKSTSQYEQIWTEKYRPKNMKSVIGQQLPSSNMNKLAKWLTNWFKNQRPEIRKKLPKPTPWSTSTDGAYYKAALLSGPPGVGKTTTATLVAKELKYDIVELNASDTRSKKSLKEEVAQLLNNTTIVGFTEGGDKKTRKMRVLLMDEVDGLAGNEDRGGMAELIELIKKSNIPIICMCNDRNHQKMRSLLNYCFDLRFTPPKLEQIRGAMMTICHRENLKVSVQTVTEIINGTNCDVRQTLNNLFMFTIGDKTISTESAIKEAKSAKKDDVMGNWEIIRKVFCMKEHKSMSLRDKSRLFFFDYSLGPLWVQENYIRVKPNCRSKNDTLKCLAQAANSLSRGDMIESQIRSTNNWALLEYQAFFSSVMPGHYMSGELGKINFPGWLGKNSSANKKKRMLVEVYNHARTRTLGDKLAMLLDYVLPLRDFIVQPLVKNGMQGVPRAVNAMKTYGLLKEDLESILELTQRTGTKNSYSTLDPKIKTAFTKAFNKDGKVMPYAVASISKKKASKQNTDYSEDESDGEEEEKEEKIDDNPMIKVKTKKTKTAPASKQEKKKPEKKETKGKKRNVKQ